MAKINMKALLETGVHFGHRTRKWNPRMKPYIFTERNGIHIIDLQQTLEAIEIAIELIRDTIAEGGSILFVGTEQSGKLRKQLSLKRLVVGCPMSIPDGLEEHLQTGAQSAAESLNWRTWSSEGMKGNSNF